MSFPYGHDECATCQNCGRHLTPEDTWPCLHCGSMLCDSCECVNPHHTENCS